VERRYPHRLDDRPDQRGDSFAHFSGSFVSERDRQDFGRMHTDVDEVCNAMREHPRLARPGAGNHQQGTTLVDHGIKLIGIETLSER
jgi:hypothetical protein